LTNRILDVAFYIALALILIVVLFPFYWMVLNAFKWGGGGYFAGEYFTYPPTFWPSGLHLDNFEEVIFGGKFVNSVFPNILNSAIVGFSTAGIVTAISTLGAFSLTRLRFKRRDDVAFFILSQRILPPVSIIIPYYFIITGIHLLDTQLGLILTYILLNLPFSVWILMTYFEEIPKELEEAAYIDGCSTMSAFRKILLPLALPGILVTAIFCVITCYNEFLFSFVLTYSKAVTLPRAIADFVTIQGTLWGQMSAASFLGILPVIAFAMIIQRHLVRAMTLGAVKG
jgi:multiple sugar transport system permease protein